MITYACVLRSGGVYTPEWVRKLSRGVATHAGGLHRFVCLSDVDVPCERIELDTNLPGWYAKLELFRPGLFDGPVIYLDLDTLVMGDLTPLEAFADGPLAMLGDFYAPDKAASGVMCWSGETDLWERRPQNVAPRQRLDYWFRKNTDPLLLQTFVDGIVSFKAHRRNGPDDSDMLCCGHGNPRFSDPRAGWAHRYWSAL